MKQRSGLTGAPLFSGGDDWPGLIMLVRQIHSTLIPLRLYVENKFAPKIISTIFSFEIRLLCKKQFEDRGP